MYETSEDPDADTVVCEVTGERVPHNETVVLHGKRVSARGKQILLDQLATGHNLDGEWEAPGFGARFGGAILDGLLLAAVGFGIGLAGGPLLANAQSDDAATRMSGIVQLLAIAVGILYFAFMHASGGRTLGKMAARTKAVNLDGSELGFGTALLRSLAFTGVQGLAPLVLILAGVGAAGVIGAVSALAGIYGLANAITLLATKDKRALHDLIAGTRVVLTQK